MNSVMQDVRFAVRALLRSPAFTAVAVLTLAVGIGANTAIFSVLNAVLLKPLPFADPGSLVMVWEHTRRVGNERNTVAPFNYHDWQRENRTLSGIAAYVDFRSTLSGFEQPEEVTVGYTTANLLTVLGVTPLIGRNFTEAEDRPGGADVVILAHDFWRQRYDGRRDAVGRTLTLNGRPHTIIGVMPASFAHGLPRSHNSPGSSVAMWSTLGFDPAVDLRGRTGRYLITFARLNPGVSAEQAEADIRAIASRLEQAYPAFNRQWTANVVPLTEQIVGSARRSLLVLAGIVGFVLLIACANVANLQLVRASARERELAVRAALGAGRARLARQLLTESVVLALAGGALGLLLAFWSTEALAVLGGGSVPRLAEVALDGRTLAFTGVVAVLTGLVFGVVPAWQVARRDLHGGLRAGTRAAASGGRARSWLVGSQVAIAMALLVGAGLLLRSFARLQAEDTGFNAANVLTARLNLGRAYDTPAKQLAFFNAVRDRLRGMPGVAAASYINFLPFNGLGSATLFFVEGRPEPAAGEAPGGDVRAVDPGYFQAMQIPLRRGTLFTDRDDMAARKAVVINEALARAYFPNEDPIGRHILMPWGDTLRGEIVAVVGDIRHQGFDSLPRPMFYWPAAQFPYPFATFVIRTTGDPLALAPSLRAAVRELDASLPVADVNPLDHYLAQSVAQRRFTMALTAAFAGIALLLAAVGLYGVLAYGVAQRTREIGVRVALGARRGAVVGLVIREGMVVVAAGIAVGTGLAFALSRVMTSLLYETSAVDPLTYVAVAAMLGGVALLASWLPARRAAKVDPMAALRAE